MQAGVEITAVLHVSGGLREWENRNIDAFTAVNAFFPVSDWVPFEGADVQLFPEPDHFGKISKDGLTAHHEQQWKWEQPSQNSKLRQDVLYKRENNRVLGSLVIYLK